MRQKTKVVTNANKTLEVMVDGGKLEEVDSFGYLGNRITDDAYCKGELKTRQTRLAMGMTAMANYDKNGKQRNKHRFKPTIDESSSVARVATCHCEVWTLKKEKRDIRERVHEKIAENSKDETDD